MTENNTTQLTAAQMTRMIISAYRDGLIPFSQAYKGLRDGCHWAPEMALAMLRKAHVEKEAAIKETEAWRNRMYLPAGG
jgi:hypothetical protein